MQDVTSPIIIRGAPGRTRIGAYPMLDEATALSAVAAAHAAYGRGMGAWPMSSVRDRIAAVEKCSVPPDAMPRVCVACHAAAAAGTSWA